MSQSEVFAFAAAGGNSIKFAIDKGMWTELLPMGSLG
jgi:hypothetical protein